MCTTAIQLQTLKLTGHIDPLKGTVTPGVARALAAFIFCQHRATKKNESGIDLFPDLAQAGCVKLVHKDRTGHAMNIAIATRNDGLLSAQGAHVRQ